MSQRLDILYGLTAHTAFTASMILDGFRRDAEGVLLYIFAIGGALLVLPAFIYFVMRPRTFFLLANRERHQENSQISMGFWRIVLFAISWLYIGGWSIGWLIYASDLPRFIAGYLFIFGIVTSILISKYLFPSSIKKGNGVGLN